MLLRHAHCGGAPERRLLVDEGEKLFWREAREARADAVGHTSDVSFSETSGEAGYSHLGSVVRAG